MLSNCVTVCRVVKRSSYTLHPVDVCNARLAVHRIHMVSVSCCALGSPLTLQMLRRELRRVRKEVEEFPLGVEHKVYFESRP